MDEEVVEEWIHRAAKNYHKWELRDQFNRQQNCVFSRYKRIEATGVACAIMQLNDWHSIETGCKDQHGRWVFIWCWSKVLEAPILLSLTKEV